MPGIFFSGIFFSRSFGRFWLYIRKFVVKVL